jgi:hypothetical protein
MQISISNAIRGKRNSNTYNKLISLFIERGIPLNYVFEAKSCLQSTLINLNLTYIPQLISSPVLTGDDYLGGTLSVSNGIYDGITPFVYSYQWYLDDVIIVGAESNTYVTQEEGVYNCSVAVLNDFGRFISFSNSITVSIIPSFISRVIADGGTFEAESCLITQIDNLL